MEVGNFDTLESRARLMSSDRYKTIMEVSQSQNTVLLPMLSLLPTTQALSPPTVNTALSLVLKGMADDAKPPCRGFSVRWDGGAGISQCTIRRILCI